MADLFASDPVSAPTDPPFDLPRADGYAAAWNPAWRGFDVTLPGGSFFYAEHFFPKAWSDRTVAYLQENDRVDPRHADWRAIAPEVMEHFTNIRWKQDALKLYGKSIPLPRLTAWYGDPGAAYSYSGIKSDPNPWNKGLLALKQRIEALVDGTFNSVLLNWYRDGRDSLSWHADDEKELGPDPVIASANFGATRDFQLRRNSDHDQVVTLPLAHGTLLVMRGALQRNWRHAVPKRTRVAGSRFNLTFRTIHG
jgi:alkylated DNA repair dioxygenase AlkB